jgi:hypothetical protein
MDETAMAYVKVLPQKFSRETEKYLRKYVTIS